MESPLRAGRRAFRQSHSLRPRSQSSNAFKLKSRAPTSPTLKPPPPPPPPSSTPRPPLPTTPPSPPSPPDSPLPPLPPSDDLPPPPPTEPPLRPPLSPPRLNLHSHLPRRRLSPTTVSNLSPTTAFKLRVLAITSTDSLASHPSTFSTSSAVDNVTDSSIYLVKTPAPSIRIPLPPRPENFSSSASLSAWVTSPVRSPLPHNPSKPLSPHALHEWAPLLRPICILFHHCCLGYVHDWSICLTIISKFFLIHGKTLGMQIWFSWPRFSGEGQVVPETSL